MTVQQEAAERIRTMTDEDARLILMIIQKISPSSSKTTQQDAGNIAHHAKVGMFDGTPAIADGYDFDELNNEIAAMFEEAV